MSTALKDETLHACLRLASLKGLNNTHKNSLLAHYHQPEAIFSASLDDIKSVLLLTSHKIRTAFCEPDEQRLTDQTALLKSHQINILLNNAADYPEQLKQIDDAPPFLFTRGNTDLLSGPQLAMVGSRNASPSGIKTAEAFAKDFAKSGLTITSGLALGIDAAAHLGALNEIGGTIAVVATGLDEVYPRRNLALAKAIVDKGLMISEFPPLTAALRGHFPRRNRLISGLSMGVLVVEADTRSGSLITARLAGEQGREIFAIPGSIHLPTSRGCHQLIRQGAKLVETTADVLVEIQPKLEIALKAHTKEQADTKPNTKLSKLNKDAQAVLNLIDFAPTTLDEISQQSKLNIEIVSSTLLELELAGLIAPVSGGQYQRLQA